MTTLTKTVLDAELIPRVEMDFMNNTHVEEIKLVKELGDQIEAYQNLGAATEQDTQKITQLLEEWQQHTQAHFDRENALMLEIQFPAFPIHSNEHEIAHAKMALIVETWKRNQDIDVVAEYVFSTWPLWFDGHVNSMDMMTAKFAVMKGLDPHSHPPA